MARRLANKLAVCLAVGLVLSVMVSWGCKLYYWKCGSRQASYTARDRHGYWSVTAWAAPGRRSYTLTPIPYPTTGKPAVGPPWNPTYSVDGFVAAVEAGLMDRGAARANALMLNEVIPGDLALAVEEARAADRFEAALARLGADAEYSTTGQQLRLAWARSRAARGDEPTVPWWVRRPTRGAGLDQLATGAYGWPMVCLKSEMEIVAGRRPANRYIGSLMIDQNAAPRGMACALPLTPVWHGLAINAAVYGGALAGVLLLLPRERRRRRVRAGLCPGCRYDLQYDFSAGCPECGWGRGDSVVALAPASHPEACDDALAAAAGYKEGAPEGVPEPGRSL